MKKLFSFFCCMLLSIAAWGDVVKVTVDDVAYNIDTEAKTAEVTYPGNSEPGTSSYTGDITIPATIEWESVTYIVTAIGDKAFRKASISSLSIGENVTSIGYESLYKSELESLTIPGNVTILAENSLKESNIKTLNLNEGLETIGKRAIYSTKISELVVPNSVTKLEKESIGYNDRLKKITFGSHIADKKWDNWVCWRASGAYEVYMICDAVPELSDDITFDQNHETRIHVKPSVFDDFVASSNWNKYNIITELGTVDGIKYLKDGRGNAYVTYPNNIEPGTSSYEGDIVIPATVNYGGKDYKVIAIEDKAFRKANITSIQLPEGLLSIGKEAIYNTKITELTIPNSVTNLGQYSLAYNETLVTVSFGKNVDANTWGAWVLYRESGGYDVYMNCDSKPSVPDKYTFDDSSETIIHVMSGLADSYNADSYWGGQYTIKGDLDKTYLYLQNAISLNESFLANEVGTDPGFYSSANPTALSNAIIAAKALTPSASGDEIAAAISAMNTANNAYVTNPLIEGYYYIESVYDGKFMKSYPAEQASDSGIENVDFSQDLKLYFELIKSGDKWLIRGNDDDKMYFGAPSGGYATVIKDATYKQEITPVGVGTFKIQCQDGENLSDPYANTGHWLTFKNYSAGSADETRMYWYFRKAEILSKTDVSDMVSVYTDNDKTSLDLSGYLLADDVVAFDIQASGKNLLVKVASTSGITGQNIVNDGVCANLVLTDAQPFGYDEDITATNATYSRDVTNTFGTICLPFAVSSDENVQYYTLNKIENSTLYLTKQEDIAAGVPAIFEMKNGTTLTATASGATIKGSVVEDNADLKLIGTFTGETVTTNLENSYYISNSQFCQATKSITVPPFRAYFTTPANSVKSFNLSTDENETAIDNVQCSMFGVQSVYDANGMELQSLRKGLNIVKMNNGNVQKIVVK